MLRLGLLAAALAAAAAAGATADAAASVHAPEYDDVTETELLELAFRARMHADSLAHAHAEVATARAVHGAKAAMKAAHAAAASAMSGASSEASAGNKVEAGAGAEAGWRFGGNFQPQHYGQWRMVKGAWSFGSDKRMECEACSYVLYMLIDRLGDQFSRVTIDQEAELLCPRVQWVFKSACDFVIRKNKAVVADLVMKLIEPADICKHLTLCPPDYYDLMGVGGMEGYGAGRAAMMMPPQYRADGGGYAAAAPGVVPPGFPSPYVGGFPNALANPGMPGYGYDMYGNPYPMGMPHESHHAALHAAAHAAAHAAVAAHAAAADAAAPAAAAAAAPPPA